MIVSLGRFDGLWLFMFVITVNYMTRHIRVNKSEDGKLAAYIEM